MKFSSTYVKNSNSKIFQPLGNVKKLKETKILVTVQNLINFSLVKLGEILN